MPPYRYDQDKRLALCSHTPLFNIIDPEGWQVQEAFSVTKLHYAAFYKGEKSVFVQVDELFSFLNGEG